LKHVSFLYKNMYKNLFCIASEARHRHVTILTVDELTIDADILFKLSLYKDLGLISFYCVVCFCAWKPWSAEEVTVARLGFLFPLISIFYNVYTVNKGGFFLPPPPCACWETPFPDSFLPLPAPPPPQPPIVVGGRNPDSISPMGNWNISCSYNKNCLQLTVYCTHKNLSNLKTWLCYKLERKHT
jgi:hypothetical protein